MHYDIHAWSHVDFYLFEDLKVNRNYLAIRAVALKEVHSKDFVELCLYYASGHVCTVDPDSNVTVHRAPSKKEVRRNLKRARFEERRNFEDEDQDFE